MTLPTNLLPTGTLAAMRAKAQEFMKTPVYLYAPQITYDSYGKQITTSGTVNMVSGYVGAISGTDRELITELLGGIRMRDGVEVREIATLLVPFGTVLDSTYSVRVGDRRYNIVWDNTNTSDSVQVYVKALLVYLARRDEQINYL